MLLLLWNPLNMTCTIKLGKLKVMQKKSPDKNQINHQVKYHSHL